MRSLSLQVLERVAAIRATHPVLDMDDLSVVLKNLMFVYDVITASENLCRVAVNNTQNRVLREYFERHLNEENGHADWLARDLMTAGVVLNRFSRSNHAVTLAGEMYYLICHVDSTALLGYMMVLEGFPTPLDRVARLETLHGKDLFRTLRYHSEHDPQHLEDLKAMVDIVEPPREGLVYAAAISTALTIKKALIGAQSGN